MTFKRPPANRWQPIFIDQEILSLLRRWAEAPTSKAFVEPLYARLVALGFPDEGKAILTQDWEWWANDIGTRGSHAAIRNAILNDPRPTAVVRLWLSRLSRGMVHGPMWDALEESDQMRERATDNINAITERWVKFGMSAEDITEEVDTVLRQHKELSAEDGRMINERMDQLKKDLAKAEEGQQTVKELLAERLARLEAESEVKMRQEHQVVPPITQQADRPSAC